jgi:hypothetical protein
MTASVRSAVAGRLGKSGTLSVKKDVFGIYSDDNPQARSLLKQLDLIANQPLVRVAQVIVTGGTTIPTPQPQRDLDNANTIYQRECGAWVYCAGSISTDRPELTFLDQDDCSLTSHSVSADEADLFDLGRGLGADIVCYYIWKCTLAFGGCSSHPSGRRGFWLGSGPNNAPASPLVAFAHELTHNVGNNFHVTTPADNLMTTAAGKTVASTLTSEQQKRILADPAMEYP